MPKITFMGAGSAVFAKNVLGDCMLTPSLAQSEFSLYDIDMGRLADSRNMLESINANLGGKARIVATLDRREALRGSDYVINAIQVGGPDIHIAADFEIPRRYGLLHTIGDTLGIGGIFRTLRTLPPMLDFAADIQELCPEAWFLNYTNPMAAITGGLLRFSGIKAVGLCHSVQACAPKLLEGLGMNADGIQWKVAGINHQGWLLEITKDGQDLYPIIKQKALERETPHTDMVRYEIMRVFGYYVTESSEHSAEYLPYFIKKGYPELIQRYDIPLDEWPRRYETRVKRWADMRESLVNNKNIVHTMSQEYASRILDAMETDTPVKIGGNVLNNGLIPNLPRGAVVEVPCLVDKSGVTPCYVGELPEQLAALNRTSINVHLLTLEAYRSKKKEDLYHAALLDPHTSAELTIDEIIRLCDEMIAAHGDWLPRFS